MKLLTGSKNIIDRLMGSCGLLRDSSTSADATKSSTTKQYGHANGFACLEVLIELRNSAGSSLSAGGHPVTVELRDVAGRVLVTADSSLLVSSAVLMDATEVHVLLLF